MTHPDTPEVGGEVNNEPADAREAFETIAADWLGEEEPAEEAEGQEPEATEEAEDELEIEAEEDELPPIEAPVSWDAEAKAKFAELPRETQEYLAKREGERERFVQQKSQEAARAKQDVERAALEQLSAYERQVSEQLQQLASQIGPQRPNPALLQHDPVAFYNQQAAYENAIAQQQQLQQQAHEYALSAQERQTQAEQAYHAEQHQKLVEAFPEYLDPTTGPELQRNLSAVARDLGYSPELISQARADDILAMKVAADWRAKAQKYDALQAKKMEKVRAAKGLPKVAKPGVPQGADQLRANRAQAAWEKTKAATNIGERADHFADYLKSTGQI